MVLDSQSYFDAHYELSGSLSFFQNRQAWGQVMQSKSESARRAVVFSLVLGVLLAGRDESLPWAVAP
jgi:hypothetical protein